MSFIFLIIEYFKAIFDHHFMYYEIIAFFAITTDVFLKETHHEVQNLLSGLF